MSLKDQDSQMAFKNGGQNAIIIGAGLAGLICGILLNRRDIGVTIIEKKKFPFHRVCGEYISNEVLPFLNTLGLNIENLEPSHIDQLTISSARGMVLESPLQQGGFGISRYVFDHHLYQLANREGVEFIFSKANEIIYTDEGFQVQLANNQTLYSPLVIGAYGKRSNLDQKLKRSFFYRRSPYLGVKYHLHTDLPTNQIRLDSFSGGYSGICSIESGKYNLCYLSEVSNLKKYGNLAEMEEQILFKNPHIRHLFKNSEFLFNKPIVINEISFDQKSLIENHVLFCGDAAGMISPLCGNGMAMAIHSGKILAESILQCYIPNSSFNRSLLEKIYQQRWKKTFAARLQTGRFMQKLLVNKHLSHWAISALKKTPSITQFLVKNTHGKAFM
ncbi:MAG TPA: NAD(P)/FAD-dependent oxidoreductase [Daejeonella sp.]|nr:NAD(P)/FAD-dependent oxidoreductase [Daejeonella sp.]